MESREEDAVALSEVPVHRLLDWAPQKATASRTERRHPRKPSGQDLKRQDVVWDPIGFNARLRFPG
eukprot:5051188-Pyramimonas_sp.AAC.1